MLKSIVAISFRWKRLYLTILVHRDKLISQDQGSQSLNCTDLDIVIDIVNAEMMPASSKPESKSKASKKESKEKPCKFETDVSFEVKFVCQGRTSCNLSVKSVEKGQCPEQVKHLIISYQCVKRSNDIHVG